MKRDLNKENSQQILDVATVLEWFFYDFGTGGLYWRKRPGARVHQNDEAGTDYFTKIIKFVVKDSNTFVISHKVDDLLEKFDETIKFEKKKGFSMMVDSD